MICEWILDDNDDVVVNDDGSNEATNRCNRNVVTSTRAIAMPTSGTILVVQNLFIVLLVAVVGLARACRSRSLCLWQLPHSQWWKAEQQNNGGRKQPPRFLCTRTIRKTVTSRVLWHDVRAFQKAADQNVSTRVPKISSHEILTMSIVSSLTVNATHHNEKRRILSPSLLLLLFKQQQQQQQHSCCLVLLQSAKE